MQIINESKKCCLWSMFFWLYFCQSGRKDHFCWTIPAIFRQNGIILTSFWFLTSFYHFLAWFYRIQIIYGNTISWQLIKNIPFGNVIWLLRNTELHKSHSYFHFLHYFQDFLISCSHVFWVIFSSLQGQILR